MGMKTVLPSSGFGNKNEKQCFQPKLGKIGLKSLGKILGKGITAHACMWGVKKVIQWMGTLGQVLYDMGFSTCTVLIVTYVLHC